MSAYERAIKDSTHPGAVVLDIGAGAGILTFLALEAGASHVYSIDKSSIIEVISQVSRAKNWNDRITCIQGDLQRIDLPEHVDLIVSDIRGCIPILQDNLAVINSARHRFLKPDGKLVPLSDTIYFAPVEFESGHEDVAGWRNLYATCDFSPISRIAGNQWSAEKIKPEDLLAEGQASIKLDYHRLEKFNFESSFVFHTNRAGKCNGIAAWFESELAPEIFLSTSPAQGETVYNQAFFPLWENYPVAPGTRIAVTIRARYLGGAHLMFWNVAVGNEPEEKHSSFHGVLMGPIALEKKADHYVPELAVEGQIEGFILSHMDGRHSLEAIARLVSDRFPAVFPQWKDAMERVGRLSANFSR